MALSHSPKGILLFAFLVIILTAFEASAVSLAPRRGKANAVHGVLAPDGRSLRQYKRGLAKQAALAGAKGPTDGPLTKPLPRHFLTGPKYRQATSWTCGVASTMVVTNYWTGMDLQEDDMVQTLKANSTDGTWSHEMVKWFQSQGFQVDVYTEQTYADLERFVDLGRPPILMIQAWAEPYSWNGTVEKYENDWEDGHFVVVVGYDAENFYFMDPSTLGFWTYIPREYLMSRWHDIDGSDEYGTKVSQFALVAWYPNADDPPYDPTLIMPLY